MSRIGFTELSPEIGSILLDALRSNRFNDELAKDVILPYVADQIRNATPWEGFYDVSFVEFPDSSGPMLNTHYIKVSGEDHEGLRLVRTYFNGCGDPNCRHKIQEGQVVAPARLLQWLKEGRELAEEQQASGKSEEPFDFQALAQKVIVDKFDEHNDIRNYIGNMFTYMDNHFNVSENVVFVPLTVKERRYPVTFRGIVLYADGDYTDAIRSVVDLRENLGPVKGLSRLLAYLR